MYDVFISAALITVLLWRVMPPLNAPQLVTPEGYLIPDEPKKQKAWDVFIHFKKGGADMPDPDPGIHDAAYKLGDLGQGAMDFFNQAYQEGTKRQDVIDQATKKVVGNMLDMSDAAKGHSQELWNRYENKYMPVEDRTIQDAMNWDSADNQAAAAAQAKADVGTATAQQKASTARQQEAMGVDPRSGRYQATQNQADTQAALNAAGAENAARTQKQMQGVQMREGVSQMGQREASLGNQTANLAAALGSGGINTGLASNQGFYQNAGLMGKGYGLGMQGYSGMGNMLLNQYQSELGAAQAEQAANSAGMAGALGGLGQLAGTGGALYMMSSKKVKENKKPVDGALGALDGLNIESWKYKDGVSDGKNHIGPYAEDWKKATGTGDGKSIPVVDAVGVTMKAVQELNKKVDQIKGAQDGK